MAGLTVTLVDRTGAKSSQSHETFKTGIMRELEKLLSDLIGSDSDATIISVRWVSQSPAPGDQDLVIHWVPDRDNSYLKQTWPETKIDEKASGHTNGKGNTSGSEFYRHPKLKTAEAYALIAAHELMHNITRKNNRELHGQGGLAADTGGTPHLPITDNDKALVKAGMQKGLPDQLL